MSSKTTPKKPRSEAMREHDRHRLMVRVPDPAMLEEWREAAALTAAAMFLSPSEFTVGPWARHVLNVAAAAVGVQRRSFDTTEPTRDVKRKSVR